MAVNYSTKYPGQTATPTTEYPFGAARNDLTLDDGTGTPLEEDWVNDWFGFGAYWLTVAGTTPSGTPENATASQIAEAMTATTADAEAGTNDTRFMTPLKTRESLAPVMPASKQGMRLENLSTDYDHDIRVYPGYCADTTAKRMLTVDSITVTKIDQLIGIVDTATEYGGFPSSLTSGSPQNNTWYRVFICAKSDGSDPYVVFDTSSTAANALADLTSAFTGTYTLYRRIGWVLTDGSANIVRFNQYGDRFSWIEMFNDYSSSPASTARFSIPVTVPPDSLGVFLAHMSTSPGNGYGILTGSGEVNVDPSAGKYMFYSTAASGDLNESVQRTELSLIASSSSEIFGRLSNSGKTLNVSTIGWVDSFEQ